jgi:hypothetical protein
MTELGDRVGRLCQILSTSDLDPVRAVTGVADPLDQITALVRAAGPEQELTPALDALDEALARADYGYVTQPGREYRLLPGQRSRSLDVWVCPALRACGRTVRDSGARCAFGDEPMKHVRLDS